MWWLIQLSIPRTFIPTSSRLTAIPFLNLRPQFIALRIEDGSFHPLFPHGWILLHQSEQGMLPMQIVLPCKFVKLLGYEWEGVREGGVMASDHLPSCWC